MSREVAGDSTRMDDAIKRREIREIAAHYQAISSGLLERVIDRLVQAFNPESIILYGSYAEGTATSIF